MSAESQVAQPSQSKDNQAQDNNKDTYIIGDADNEITEISIKYPTANSGLNPKTEQQKKLRNDYDRTQFSSKRWTDWFLILFSGLLVLFTALLWKSTEKLWEVAQEQNRDMKASIAVAQNSLDVAEVANKLNRNIFMLRERPWIKITDLKWIEPNPVVFPNHETINLRMVCYLKNVGTTIATDVKYGFDLIPIEPSQNLNISERLKTICMKRKSTPQETLRGFPAISDIVGYLFPDDMAKGECITGTTSDYLNRATTILIIAYVTYKFPFDDTIHITGVPYMVSRKNQSPIFPVQKDDILSEDKKIWLIPANKLLLNKYYDAFAD